MGALRPALCKRKPTSGEVGSVGAVVAMSDQLPAGVTSFGRTGHHHHPVASSRRAAAGRIVITPNKYAIESDASTEKARAEGDGGRQPADLRRSVPFFALGTERARPTPVHRNVNSMISRGFTPRGAEKVLSARLMHEASR